MYMQALCTRLNVYIGLKKELHASCSCGLKQCQNLPRHGMCMQMTCIVCYGVEVCMHCTFKDTIVRYCACDI